MLARIHLPEMRRDGAARALPELHLPDFELPEAVSKLEMPKLEMPKLEMPKLEMPKLQIAAPDLGKVVMDAGVALGLRQRPEPPRWLLAAGGLAVAALAGVIAAWAFLRDQTMREPVARAVQDLRTWVAGVQSSVMRRLGRRTELIALDVAPAEVAPATAAAPEVAPVLQAEFVESGEPC